MKLSVRERLMVLSLLPSEADITTLKIVRDVQEGLGFSEEEQKLLEFSREGEMTRWNPEGEAVVGEKNVPFGPKALEIVRDRLQKLNVDKQLQMAQVSLYEKFCCEQGDEGAEPSNIVAVPVDGAEH